MKKSIGAIQLGFRPKLSFIDAADFEYYRMLKEWQIIDPYSRFLNSAAVSLGFNDQYNYYLADGFKIRAMKKLGRHVSLTLDYVSENQASVNNYYKKFQILKRKELFRINPQIDDGRDARIGLSLQINNSPYDIQFIPQNCLIAGIELSRPFLNSDFNYTKMYAAGQLKIKTFYNELFLSPYLLLNAEASYLKGDYGVQHILSPVAAMGVYSPATAFKGLSPYRFTGDKMIAFHAEHNWRTIIFQALGLDFLTNSDLDIVTGGSVLRIWNDSKYFSELTQQKPYWEVYAGISRILGVIKLDFYYSSFKSVGATLSAAVIF